MKNAIEICWNSYRKLIPAQAPPTQIRETKRAFYAGARSVAEAICFTTFYGQDPRAALIELKNLEAELDAFVEQVRQGKA